MNTHSQHIIRGIEFVFLFFGIPLIISFGARVTHPVFLLVPVSMFFILYFWFNKDFKFKSLIRWNISRKMIWINAVLVLLAGLALTTYVYMFEQENLFYLPQANLPLWLFLCISYPLFSASLQELIYRTFIFTRYDSLFKNRYVLILASAVSFSFVHIVYYSLLSLALTFIAGIYLAWIYEKTKSVLFTALIHGILGNLVFTIGLGHHFWQNMEKWL